MAAGILLATAVTTHADEYQFRHYLSGLKPAQGSVPEEPAEPGISWDLGAATLPKATVGEAYSYSFYDLVTPTRLDGFSWAGQSIPSWASLDADTGLFSGTPSASDAGSKTFAVSATRADKSDQKIYSLEVAGEPLKFSQIDAGSDFTCGLTTAGAVKCWGSNLWGQLGDGTNTSSSVPVQVLGLTSGVKRIAVGWYHACAITSSNGVKCWGTNNSGQLGDNSTATRLSPVSVYGLTSGVTYLAAGYTHTCVVTTAGSVKCWGRNNYGQVGDSSTTDRQVPTQMIGATTGISKVFAGSSHTCVVTISGAAKCVGRNSTAQLGNNSLTNSSALVSVSGLTSGVATMSINETHSCAITTSGAAKCWGSNSSGQLGDNGTQSFVRMVPSTVYGMSSGVASISTGNSHTCAVTTAGAVKCWGLNNGTIGDDTTTNRSVPTQTSGLTTGAKAIATGNVHSCAIDSDGIAKCWGRNTRGGLGDGTQQNRLTPVDVLTN